MHILHYGDSQIEGDRITARIRQLLQEKFGGNGPGLMPAVQPFGSYTIYQEASENIERFIVTGTLQNKTEHSRYGALGQVAVIEGDTSSIFISVENAKKSYKNIGDVVKISMYVGHTSNFITSLTCNNLTVKADSVIRANNELKIYTWTLKKPTGRFRINIQGSAEIYGICAEGNDGICVDNIALRGSSGSFFSSISKQILQGMYDNLNIQLVILQFGGNSVPYLNSSEEISGFGKIIAREITFLKTIMPNAKFIFIGPSDMSTKVNGRLQTYPFLPELVEKLKSVTTNNDVVFWNMYEAMGGENSMIEWVSAKPALAATDYVHFSRVGSDKIANLFFNSLMTFYYEK